MSQLRCPNCDTPLVGSACPNCGWTSQQTVRIGDPQRKFSIWPYVFALIGLVVIILLGLILLRPSQPAAPVPTSQPIILVQSPTPEADQATPALPVVEQPTQETTETNPTAAIPTQPTGNVITQYESNGTVIEMNLQQGDIARFPAGYLLVGRNITVNGTVFTASDENSAMVVILEEEADITDPHIIYQGQYENLGSNFRNVTVSMANALLGHGNCVAVGCKALMEICPNSKCSTVNIVYWPSRKQELVRP